MLAIDCERSARKAIEPMKFFLPSALLLAGCVSNTAQVQPALSGAAELKRLFDYEQSANRALIERSNPSAPTLQAYTAAQQAAQAAFNNVYAAHVLHLGSLGGLSAEATAAMLDQVTKSATEILGPRR